MRFYEGIYLDAFAAQREPLETWQAALRGELPYAMHVRVVLDGDDIAAGSTYELYPQSRCGFRTYMVVAPHAQRRGLGRRLFTEATTSLYARGASIVLSEVDDPRVHGDAARPRLARFERWGARVLDVTYVQPSLGAGLPRDRSLCLLAAPRPDGHVPALSATTLRAWLRELYAVTEGGEPDAELLDMIRDPIVLRPPLREW